jgi:hypothetical protein
VLQGCGIGVGAVVVGAAVAIGAAAMATAAAPAVSRVVMQLVRILMTASPLMDEP